MDVDVIRAERKIARWAEKRKEVDKCAGRAASTRSQERHRSVGLQA